MELKKIFNNENYNLLLTEAEKSGDKYKYLLDECPKLVEVIFDKINFSNITPIEGCDIYFASLMNDYIKGKRKDQIKERIISQLGMMIYNSMPMYMSLYKSEKIDDKILYMLENKLIRVESSSDNKTGNHISLSLTSNFDFKVRATTTIKYKTESGHKGYQVVEVENIKFDDSIRKKRIVFKTGNLIINDWFRTSNHEFTNAVKNEDSICINSARGRMEAINYYADKFNMVSVNIGNTSPNVAYDGTKILCGQLNDESLKSVCTDLWNATIIEEENLCLILQNAGMTKKQAQIELKKLKKIWTCITMKVDPGVYELNFCADYELFSKKYKLNNKNHGLHSKVKPYFTLEKVDEL